MTEEHELFELDSRQTHEEIAEAVYAAVMPFVRGVAWERELTEAARGALDAAIRAGALQYAQKRKPKHARRRRP